MSLFLGSKKVKLHSKCVFSSGGSVCDDFIVNISPTPKTMQTDIANGSDNEGNDIEETKVVSNQVEK